MTTVSALPSTLDFRLYAGDGFACQLLFIEASSGALYPLEGTFKAEIKHDGTVVTEWTIDTSEALEGKLRLSLSSVQTRQLAGLTPASWDLQQTDGDLKTWHRGTILVYSDVTT